MKKPFDVYNEVYGQNLHVILDMPKEKIRPYLEKKFKVKWDYDETYGAGCLLTFDTAPYSVLWLRKGLPKEDFIPKLTHEVFHHVLRLCKKVNIPTYPHIDNLTMDEAAAYLMEFYVREILRKR